MPKEIRLAIWIIVFILVVLAFLFWILYPLFRKKMMRKNPIESYYRHIMRLAKYGDYYLINGLKIRSDDPSSPKIDHILVGNKYFYLIYDYYFEGAVDANMSDDYWLYHKDDGKKERLFNPMRLAADASDQFSLVYSLNPSFLITIVLINDDCFISQFKNDEAHYLLTPLSKLDRLVDSFEKQDIAAFDANELEKIVQKLHARKEKEDA